MTGPGKLFALRPWAFALALLSLIWPGIWPGRAGLAEPLLSYVVEDGGRAEWRIWNAARSRDRLFLELREAPEHTFWDPAARTVTFVAQGGTYRARFDQSPGRPERLGPAPDAPGEIEILWREARDGSLRAIAIYVVPKADLIGDGEALSYRLPDGRTIPGIPDPKWHYYTVCTLQEMTAPDAWSIVRQAADVHGYEGEPCTRLDVTSRRERGTSQFTLHESYRCARSIDRSSSTLCLEEVPPALGPAFEAYKRSEAFKASGTWYDAVRYLATDQAYELAYGVGEGHALHVYGQVFVVAPDKGGIEPLALEVGPQLQIGLTRGYVLVAEEYSGADPHVIDLASGRVVFRARGHSALWVPE